MKQWNKLNSPKRKSKINHNVDEKTQMLMDFFERHYNVKFIDVTEDYERANKKN